MSQPLVKDREDTMPYKSNPDELAITFAYLWRSFMQTVDKLSEVKPVLRRGSYETPYAAFSDGLGELGISVELLPYAHLIEALLEASHSDGNLEYPAVFHYEVTEGIGQWLAVRAYADWKLPLKSDAAEQILQTVLSWWDSPGESDLNRRLRCAVDWWKISNLSILSEEPRSAAVA